MVEKTKVLIVDDSSVFRAVLKNRLSSSNFIEVVGTAPSAFVALEEIKHKRPDVISLDIEMPGLSGVEFLKQLIPVTPIPTVLVSSLNFGVFEALSVGAVDFVKKPDMTNDYSVDVFINELIASIKIAAMAQVQLPKEKPHNISNLITNTSPPKRIVIAIGASTGGTEATLEILKQLPSDYPGILVTQHMPRGFTKMYAERLNKLCQMEVKEAESGDKVTAGKILIAPGDAHMRLSKVRDEFTVRCYRGEKVSGHCPSVDVLFESVASVAGQNSVGIILTGMGRDGASGLLKMKKSGAFTIGQDKESSVVYGMPMVAYNIGAVVKQVALDEITQTLKNYINSL